MIVKKEKTDFFLSIAFLLCAILTFPTPEAKAQTINTITGINFGSYDFDTTFNGAIQLGTNGSVNVFGSGIIYNGGAISGQIRITSPTTGIVDIKCANTAQMVAPPAAALNINQIQLAVSTGVAFGDGDVCAGLGGADPITTTIDLDANPNPDIFIGGQIDLPTPVSIPAVHNYSSAGTGTPIMLSIVLQ